MKRIKTIETRDLKKSVKNGGCGECQTSCQSACKMLRTNSARSASRNKHLKKELQPLSLGG